MITTYLLFLLTTYLIAAVPFGLFLTKIFTDKDIRDHGSKNIGATNVARVVGKKLGLATLILDGIKGAFMVLLATIIFKNEQNIHALLAIVAGVAVIGHIFPIYLKFKGGKGVATTLATLLALNPIIGIATLLTWIIVFLIFRISAAASLISILASILTSIFYGAPLAQIILCFILFLLILYRHKENISRLLQGKENKV